jgi:hypothetical protein
VSCTLKGIHALYEVFQNDWRGYEEVLRDIGQAFQQGTGGQRTICSLLQEIVVPHNHRQIRSFTPCKSEGQRTIVFSEGWSDEDRELSYQWAIDPIRIVADDVYVQKVVADLAAQKAVGWADDGDILKHYDLVELRRLGSTHGMNAAKSVCGGLITTLVGPSKAIGISLQTTSHTGHFFYENARDLCHYLLLEVKAKKSFRAKIFAANPLLTDYEMEAYSLKERGWSYAQIAEFQGVKEGTIGQRLYKVNNEKFPILPDDFGSAVA